MEESPSKRPVVISCLMLTPRATCGRDWPLISRTEIWQELRAQIKLIWTGKELCQ